MVTDTLAGIHIGVSTLSGEASFTDKTRARILEAIAEDPLLMADILKDCVGEYTAMYELSMTAFRTEWEIYRHTKRDTE